jgi:hypothetical protein
MEALVAVERAPFLAALELPAKDLLVEIQPLINTQAVAEALVR